MISFLAFLLHSEFIYQSAVWVGVREVFATVASVSATTVGGRVACLWRCHFRPDLDRSSATGSGRLLRGHSRRPPHRRRCRSAGPSPPAVAYSNGGQILVNSGSATVGGGRVQSSPGRGRAGHRRRRRGRPIGRAQGGGRRRTVVEETQEKGRQQRRCKRRRQ